MKNILVPTDFSENSLNALKYAISFFENLSINFHLLHVSTRVDSPEKSNFQELLVSNLNENSHFDPIEKLKAEVHKIKKLSTNINHNFYFHHEYNQFVDSVRKLVNDQSIDYIVLGTKGGSKISKEVLGSHTADVITRVKCTALVIPENARYTKPHNIVFPTDFNIYYKSKLLQTLSEFLKVKDTTLNVLFVSKIAKELSFLQKKNRGYLQDYLQEKPHSFYFIINENIDNAIETFVSTNRVDIIAMVAKNLNFFQRILFQPPAEKISYHTRVPFLVLHE